MCRNTDVIGKEEEEEKVEEEEDNNDNGGEILDATQYEQLARVFFFSKSTQSYDTEAVHIDQLQRRDK